MLVIKTTIQYYFQAINVGDKNNHTIWLSSYKCWW